MYQCRTQYHLTEWGDSCNDFRRIRANAIEWEVAMLDVSVVIPVFNESGILETVYAELTDALDDERRRYELIFVDDGSTDASYDILARLHAKDPRTKVIRLAQNFGQQAALSAGLEHAKGRAIVSLDADGQCNPHDISKLLAKLEEGYDVVSGWRVQRKDRLLRRLLSFLANKAIGRVTGVPLHDYGCPLKAITREVAHVLPQYGERRRFLEALIVQVGRSVAEVTVSHRPRMTEKSKYSFLRLAGHYLDFVMSFSTRPFQIVGTVGILLAAAGLLGGALYFPLRYLLGVPVGARFQILLFLLAFLGLQFVIVGLLGEFTVRIYRLVQNRPFFVIKDSLE